MAYFTPSLHHRLSALPWADIPVGHRSEGKGHGRRETRIVHVTAVATGIGFPHAALVARIHRTRTNVGTGKTSTETVYAITSLSWQEATPAHWPR